MFNPNVDRIGLNGTLPNEISALQSVQSLSFSDAGLVGTLPEALGTFTSLQFLQFTLSGLVRLIHFVRLQHMYHFCLLVYVLTFTFILFISWRLEQSPIISRTSESSNNYAFRTH